jgi:hypothetical protein
MAETTDWQPYRNMGLDLARGPDKTAWRCFCGKSGIVTDDDQGCDAHGCPVREALS